MAIAWFTFSRVEFATFSGVWIARDTVAIETCAMRATSSIVAGLDDDKLALTRRWQCQSGDLELQKSNEVRGHYTDWTGGQTALAENS